MAITGFMESGLTTSEIFSGEKGINKVTDKEGRNQLQKAIELAKHAKRLTNEDIEAAYISVKQITDTLTRAALKAFDEGKIILLYNQIPANAVTQALPFITLNSKNGYQTFIFMDKYISINKDGVMTISAPILRDLLIGGLLSNALKHNYSSMISNQYLQKTMMDIYTQFICRVLNRQFAIMPDKVCLDTIKYWINKFFLINVFGINDTNENIDTLALSQVKYIDDLKMSDIKQQYSTANPTKISELLELVKTASPRMRTLNLASFLNDWIVYYYTPSMLAVDTIEYFIFMVLCLLSGTNIISIAASDIVKETRNIKSLRAELLKLV